MGRASRSSPRAPARRTRLPALAARGDAARCRLPSRHRYAGSHHGPHRDSPRRAHGGRGDAVLHLAARHRTTSDVILDVHALAFGYHGRRVGHDVTFSLAAGEVFCLLGPNGSGKTTLFKTILRLLAPLGGDVVADGRSTRRWSRQA